jgi:hypothetical protein
MVKIYTGIFAVGRVGKLEDKSEGVIISGLIVIRYCSLKIPISAVPGSNANPAGLSGDIYKNARTFLAVPRGWSLL